VPAAVGTSLSAQANRWIPPASIRSVATIKANNPLLGSKRREVAERVLTAGFSKNEFDFLELQAREIITALVYLPDRRYLFAFYPPGSHWIVDYSPAEHTASSGDVGVGDWENVLVEVDSWLSYLKRELGVSDPWAAFFESVEPFNIGDTDDDNSSFTQPEREAISRQLEEFRTYLLDEGVKSDEDRHAILATMDRIEKATGRLGRLDWRAYAIGALIELALVGYASPEGVRSIVNVLVGAAQHLLR
jgi:hypothetical protein